MIRGLIALAFGSLSFGVAEFVVMGLLPYFAKDFSIDIATTSHAISAYAFGVCAGVLYMMFTRRLNLKVSIIIIVSCHILGMLLTALSHNFAFLVLSRFISGLPHGCFFGLGAIIAMRISQAGRGSSAMALMLAGQTTSIIFGVPLGTALAHSFSWRAIFIIMTIWGLLVVLSLWRWLPDPGKLEDRGFWHQFNFLKDKAPYLVGLSIMLGNGGVFCMQSYISPLLTDFVGVPLVFVSTILIVMGIAMTIYNLAAGRLCDLFTPGSVAMVIFFTTIMAMMGTYFWGQNIIVGVVLLVYASGCLFGLSTPQQVSILRSSPGGELIGVAFGQIAFNFGNAVGAFCGSIPIELGYGVQSALLVASALVALGCIVMFIYVKFSEPALTLRYLKEQKQRHEAARQAHLEALAANKQQAAAADAAAPAAANVAAGGAADTGATADATEATEAKAEVVTEENGTVAAKKAEV